MAVGLKTGNGVEAELVDADAEDVTEGYDAQEDEPGLIARYTTVEATGETALVIEGMFSTTIKQVTVDGKDVFVSDAFGGHQTTLKKALDAAARNTVARSIAAAYEAANPKPEKTTRTRAPKAAALSEDMIAAIARASVEQYIASQAAAAQE